MYLIYLFYNFWKNISAIIRTVNGKVSACRTGQEQAQGKPHSTRFEKKVLYFVSSQLVYEYSRRPPSVLQRTAGLGGGYSYELACIFSQVVPCCGVEEDANFRNYTTKG